MDDDAIRAIRLSLQHRVVASYRALYELRKMLHETELSILKTQDIISRSDLLIRSVSECFVGGGRAM
jgi:hypothetical protein